MTSPYISFNGLALRTSGVPAYSTGAFGPSAFVLQLQQSTTTPSDKSGAAYTEIVNGVTESSSPDGRSSNTVYYTAGAATPQEQDCDAIVATLQANALSDEGTITLPFSYSIVVSDDSTYGPWAVCASGALTLLSTPLYLSSASPSVYVIKAVTGSRTFYNSWDQPSTSTIVGATATSATDANLYYPDSGGNIFPGSGLTFTLDSNGQLDNSLVNPASNTVFTVSTSISSGVLNVRESYGDYNSIKSVSYTAGGTLPNGHGIAPLCPVTAYPASPATTTLSFSLTWTSSAKQASICMQGTLTMATQAVTTVSSSSYTYYPVVAASGSRVYTDLSIGQSYTQTIAGVAPAFSVSVNGVVNDNLLGVPVGSTLSSAAGLTADVTSFGLALSFGTGSSLYYPDGLGSSFERLVTGTGNDGLVGVVDGSFTPDNSTSVLLYASAAAAPQCATVTNSSLTPTSSTTYYWKVNGTINSLEAAECMAGTLQTGTALVPNGQGQVGIAVTGCDGHALLLGQLHPTTRRRQPLSPDWPSVPGHSSMRSSTSCAVHRRVSRTGLRPRCSTPASCSLTTSPSDVYYGQSSTLQLHRAISTYELWPSAARPTSATGVPAGTRASSMLGQSDAPPAVGTCSLASVSPGHPSTDYSVFHRLRAAVLYQISGNYPGAVFLLRLAHRRVRQH